MKLKEMFLQKLFHPIVFCSAQACLFFYEQTREVQSKFFCVSFEQTEKRK